MPAIEIFRTGKHTAMDGSTVEIGPAELAAIAAAYDPQAYQAPLVVGHPKTDDPAYGWVEGLDVADDRLVASVGQVDEAFADLVGAGRFKHVSASFYRPGAPNNPRPGEWYLRHVGFLGAQAPAVKGLRQVSFADKAEDIATFGELQGRTVLRVLRSIRDWLLTDFGTETADKVLPGHEPDWLADDLAAATAASPASADAQKPAEMAQTDEDEDMTDKKSGDGAADAEALARRQAELDEREAAAKKRDAEFAEREAKARREENGRFLDGLIEAGTFAPGHKAGMLDFMDGLDAAGTVEFGEGESAVKETPLGYLKGLLAKSGTVVDLSERSGGDGGETVDLADGVAIGLAASRYMDEQKAKGVTVTSAEAVRHVTKGGAK